MNKKSSTWKKLGLENDYIFSKVMQDEVICKQLLQKLLHIKIEKLDYVEEQKNINIKMDAKSVRLDIYVADTQRVFNVEMQVANQGDLPKRTRYYQGMIDMNTIEKGAHYNSLKESYVIFICLFDPFGCGLSRYTFDYKSNEKEGLLLEDGAHKIFFNAKAYRKEEDEDSRAFLQYLQGKRKEELDNHLVDLIKHRIDLVKLNPRWEVEYMTLLMRDHENFEDGLKQGMEKGMEKGIKKGMEKFVSSLRSMKMADEIIVEELVKQYGVTKIEGKRYLSEL